MTSSSYPSEPIKKFLIHNIEAHSKDLARVAAAHFQVSRQAINRHLRELADTGIVIPSGNTRARKYSLAVEEFPAFLALDAATEEHEVWNRHVLPHLDGISTSFDILQYGFTEMVNNAIDHSEGTQLTIFTRRSAIATQFVISDNGIGIFEKIRRSMNLADEREAILELTKGKLTTDPTKHTGEGIFFTSRMFDTFSILSGHYFFHHMPDDSDWLLEATDLSQGTLIRMAVATDTSRTLMKVFDKYTTPGRFGFNITHVPVALAKHGAETLVSRSQAKRLLSRFDRFSQVILNFAGVDSVGQAFADEVFRVFPSENEGVTLRWTNTAPDVEKMIGHVLANVSRDDLAKWFGIGDSSSSGDD